MNTSSNNNFYFTVAATGSGGYFCLIDHARGSKYYCRELIK